tara:strand:- start:369 stop:962 length:594 start_codon:yes stop_codon:yes gene_type:complete
MNKIKYIISVFFLTLFIIFVVGSGDDSSSKASGPSIPQKEIDFINKYWKLDSDKSYASTDAKKNHARSIFDKYASRVFPVLNWYGEITEVTNTYITVSYKSLDFWLYPKGQNIDFLDWDVGMKLYFSGFTNGPGTWSDGIYIDCLEINNLNKSGPHFKATDTEMNYYKEQVKSNKELDEALDDFFNEMGKALKDADF